MRPPRRARAPAARLGAMARGARRLRARAGAGAARVRVALPRRRRAAAARAARRGGGEVQAGAGNLAGLPARPHQARRSALRSREPRREPAAVRARCLAIPRPSRWGEFGVGRIAAVRGNHEEAITRLQRALALSPNGVPPTMRSRSPTAPSAAATRRSARSNSTRNTGRRGRRSTDRVLAEIRTIRDDAAANLARGLSLAAAGDVAGAIAAHEAALAKQPVVRAGAREPDLALRPAQGLGAGRRRTIARWSRSASASAMPTTTTACCSG